MEQEMRPPLYVLSIAGGSSAYQRGRKTMAAKSSLFAVQFPRITLIWPQRKYGLGSGMEAGAHSVSRLIQFMTECHELYLARIWFVFEL